MMWERQRSTTTTAVDCFEKNLSLPNGTGVNNDVSIAPRPRTVDAARMMDGHPDDISRPTP
jgi:hypothetical protein